MRTDPRRGVILVAVLWTIALLSALAMATSVTFREFAGIVTVDRDRLRADALLTAGLETAAGVITRWPDDRPLYDAEMTFRLSTGAIRARVTDEGGRVDIGKAPVEVLASLLRHVGSGNPDGIARSIVDWRVTVGGAPPPGAKSGTKPGTKPDATPTPPAAQNAANTAPPAGQNQPATTGQHQKKPQDDDSASESDAMPFTDIRQLLNVPGVTPELVATVAPFITVFGSEKINALTASPQLLAALPGMNSDRIAAFLDARRRMPKDSPQLTMMLGSAQPYVVVGGRKIASVVIQARVSDGYTAAAQAVILPSPKDDQPYRVLAWNPWPAALSKW